MGFLASQQFGFSLRGVIYAVGLACVTQGLELVNLHRARKNYLKAASIEATKKNKKDAWDMEAKTAEMNAAFKKEAPFIFGQNVAIFTAVTVIAAEIATRVYGV